MSTPDQELAALEARLEAARTERLKLATDNAAADKIAKIKAEAEAEERGLAEDKKIAELTEKHGPIGKAWDIVRTDAGMIALKKPNHLLFKRFQDKESPRTDDIDALLVRPCLLWPTKAEFDVILEEVPAALLMAANVCSVLAGIRQEGLAKK